MNHLITAPVIAANLCRYWERSGAIAPMLRGYWRHSTRELTLSLTEYCDKVLSEVRWEVYEGKIPKVFLEREVSGLNVTVARQGGWAVAVYTDYCIDSDESRFCAYAMQIGVLQWAEPVQLRWLELAA